MISYYLFSVSFCFIGSLYLAIEFLVHELDDCAICESTSKDLILIGEGAAGYPWSLYFGFAFFVEVGGFLLFDVGQSELP